MRNSTPEDRARKAIEQLSDLKIGDDTAEEICKVIASAYREAEDHIKYLRAMNAELLDAHGNALAEIHELEALNGELLEVLKDATEAVNAAYQQSHAEYHYHDSAARRYSETVLSWEKKAAALIAKAEGGTG